MKLFHLPSLVLAGLMMVGCGGDSEEGSEGSASSESIEISAVPAGYIEHTIDKGGFTGTIRMPENAYIYTSTKQTNDGTFDVLQCQMDMSGGHKVTIEPMHGSFQDQVKRIKEHNMDKFKAFLIEEPNLVVYSYEDFMDDSKVGYNFAMEVDGLLLTGSADSFGDLTKEDAADLLAIAKTYKK